jgi:tyrosyl-tRNA synthetase
VTLGFLEELRWRGLLHQATAGVELEQHLATPGRVGYAGFDPTKDSLTIGHLIPMKLLTHFQRAGHKPIILIGGGTAMIGDPSGKDAERQLLDREQIEANVVGQRRIFERLLDIDADGSRSTFGASIVNNADWLDKLGYIQVLRDVGKHFSVNAMIQRDSVRDRLTQREQGISYTEFSYMLLQAYDFLHLKRASHCSVQMAGSDQYGNIVSGIELIHRAYGRAEEAFGVTAPLVKRADGKKIGKTEQGAIWLTADRTSPYAFYQYWINVEDADVIAFLKWFTFASQDEVTAIAQRHAAAPHERSAQRELARQMTRMIHGESELAKVEAATQALFGGDVTAIAEDMLREVFADVPHSEHDRAQLAGEGVALVELLAQTTLVASKREAKQFLETGAVSVNGVKAGAALRLTSSDLLHGHTILLKRGKKNWHATHWR